MLAASGVVVRGLTTASRFVHGTIMEFWRTARFEVTGEEVVPPRKVY
jgi:hypothetical protein